MNADDFAQKLLECTPPISRLEEKGLSSKSIERYLSGNRIIRREGAIQPTSENPLLDLVERFDTSTAEIGMVTFEEQIMLVDRGWIVGKDEADPILIYRDTGEVVLEDHASSGFVISRCAKGGGEFLDALISAAKFLARCAVDDDLSKNQPLACQQAAICGELAGGSDYELFYRDILGCEA